MITMGEDKKVPRVSIRAVTVAVDYTDLLRVTLPYNRHHFDKVLIVTSSRDSANIYPLAEANDCLVCVTDAFYQNGASFNKWAALEDALDVFDYRQGWLCIMDADVLWPKEEAKSLHRILQPGRLYSPLRRMCYDVDKFACPKCKGKRKVETSTEANKKYRTFAICDVCNNTGVLLPDEDAWRLYPIHRNVNEWAGYTQIFHASDPVLGPPPWHQIDWKHAGGADSFFQQKWPADRKDRPTWHVLHLGEAGRNWFGRATPYVDGSMPEDRDEKLRAVDAIWTGRRERRAKGLDQFKPEKLG